jgi:murein DD-endopeptidase MepM/ murein hydrolase activator NlpD
MCGDIEGKQMTSTNARRDFRGLTASILLLGVSACGPLDYDLRGTGGGFTTATAAQQVATEPRPQPDARGIISYPNYQVAVAERGETIQTMATRLGVDATTLAQFNGIEQTTPLRRGEVIALPARVSEPATVASGTVTGSTTPGGLDIGAVAGGAIERAGTSNGAVQTAALPPAASPPARASSEPIRHKVERGETAYTIARLYRVPVKSLGEWNGLGPDFAIREGQYLLIPVAQGSPQEDTRTAAVVPPPGTGSPTPTPPSASTPLPEPEEPLPAVEEPPVDLGGQTVAAETAAMVFPVDGSIIREYAPGRSEGIGIKASPGTPVVAADAGTVAAITKSAEGIPIVVIRHDPDLLTVYANVTDLKVEKGDRIARGAPIASLRDGDESYVHFEVRQGFDSVDPMLYLQ